MPQLERQTKDYFELSRALQAEPWYTYYLFHNWLDKHDLDYPDTYFSTTMSSGGYAWKLRQPDSTDWVSKAIQKNNDLSEKYLNLLADEGEVTSSNLVILPCDVGKKPGWEELDYMLYWFHGITGVDPTKSEIVEKMVRSAVPREFSNHGLDPEARWTHYEKFVDQYIQAIKLSGAEIKPVKRVIRLLDPDSSLGCRAEYILAERLNIPVKKLHINDMQSNKLDGIRDELQALSEAGMPLQMGELVPRRTVILTEQTKLPSI